MKNEKDSIFYNATRGLLLDLLLIGHSLKIGEGGHHTPFKEPAYSLIHQSFSNPEFWMQQKSRTVSEQGVV